MPRRRSSTETTSCWPELRLSLPCRLRSFLGELLQRDETQFLFFDGPIESLVLLEEFLQQLGIVGSHAAELVLPAKEGGFGDL